MNSYRDTLNRYTTKLNKGFKILFIKTLLYKYDNTKKNQIHPSGTLRQPLQAMFQNTFTKELLRLLKT